MKQCDKMSNPKILAIKLACNRSGATSIAIFDEGAGQTLSCDSLFATNHAELGQKIRRFWDDHIGSDKEPKFLYLEYPQAISHRVILMIGILCSHIENQFSPTTTFRKQSSTRKTDIPKYYRDAAKMPNDSLFADGKAPIGDNSASCGTP